MLSDFENTKEDQITEQETLLNKYAGLHKDEGAQKPSFSHQTQQVGKLVCPKCGSLNESEADFCASCGESLHASVCPNCGAEIDPSVDFCEKCHHYIKNDICSFCGAHLSGDEAYCPECGSPRGGIVCPQCHTLNEFAFCKKCGMALTEEAKAMVAELHNNKDFIALSKVASLYIQLDNSLPYESAKDKELSDQSEEFRRHVLTLLANDNGIEDPEIPVNNKERKSLDEILHEKEKLMIRLASLFETMKVPPTDSAVSARNYAMACKPADLRLGWICNYKHAVHAGPCGCAKPQMGGKWIILGSNQNTKDDK
ncbi:MAG: zinc ribbon domain-containing protein [Prevotella sp.]|nr:zinc ribbon domain-containing protein [Prevotella sp.]